MDWLQALSNCRSKNQSCVLVTIMRVEGSAPRTAGTRMLVTADEIVGTIGGGALELEGISHARALMECGDSTPALSTHEYNLSKALSQCCGGKITLLFDHHKVQQDLLHVFGAGHVAQEVARLAMRLPLVALFHDTRVDWLQKLDRVLHTSDSATHYVSTRLISDNIYQHVESLAPAAFYLVMTHSHEQDLDVVEAVLSRSDARYCGLIASKSKAASFRNRLSRKGFSAEEIAQLTAPLGAAIRTGNTPMEVALAAMSDVLTIRADDLEESEARAIHTDIQTSPS